MATKTVTTTASTALELGHTRTEQQARGTIQLRGGGAASHDPSPSGSDSDLDPILEASRIADATVPDGGRGWAVVAACAVVSFWLTGVNYSWGVMQSALVARGLGAPATLSFVGSIPATLISVMAMVNARIIRRVGTRWTAVAGVATIGLAQVLAGFATESVAGLYVTAGAMLGVGMSLCFTVCSVTPAQYFKRRRGLANGLVFAGGGLGGAVITIVEDVLIRRSDPAWAYRVMGLATLATGLPAALFVTERTRAVAVVGAIEWRLFRDVRFSLMFVAGAIATFPLLVPAFFLPLYASSLGLSAATGAALLAGFNFSSAVGRILCGLLADKAGATNTMLGCLLVSALGMLVLWPTSTTVGPLAVFAVLNGAANGGFFSTIPTVVGNVFGSARVVVALGMIVTGWAGGYLMGAPIAGYILDAYGGQDSGLHAYRPAMFYAGSLALAAAVLVGVMRLRMNVPLLGKV
ncbi:Major facilitator superfamily domain, general substrate transporter [Cordyceps fumosorosea ARSEF 2679]|uniref:Major facilitator superfamily domain, general substrate transporter n=1 Tax=Cordyceps fumosorosea (strain ARSEF 2679) TaxID=1081104 RepID=A0A162LGX4_CORFA|nr:Major facilitator superfamily domain, general substrate transporter [Cordyceps fumosorosea ARSEF 2679]OAA70434.1 Major facilitator superfamily domain, general substrate transporter [Cordyceps fumosorosea ARSEF 2679]